MRIRRLPGAITDLDEIYAYVAAHNELAAGRLVHDVAVSIEGLADYPYKGRERPDIHPTARSRPVGRYLILYRVTEATVDIVRVMHGARDLTAAREAFD